MTEVRLGEDRPRNVRYSDGDFEVSLTFGWANTGTTPSSISVRVVEQRKSTNLAQTNPPIQQEWSTYVEAESEGRNIATQMIKTWPKTNEVTGVAREQRVTQIV